jgi:hypothetical protein
VGVYRNWDEFVRQIPFSLRRGEGQLPADRTPARGAVIGVTENRGRQVVSEPGRGVREVPPGPAPPIPTEDPVLPDPDKVPPGGGSD